MQFCNVELEKQGCRFGYATQGVVVGEAEEAAAQGGLVTWFELIRGNEG